MKVGFITRMTLVSMLLATSLFGLSFVSLNIAYAQAQPSQAQIEQFRRLPRAQQEALARQYGIDTNMLQQQSSGQSAAEDEETVASRSEDDNEAEQEQAREQREARDRDDNDLRPFGYDIFSGQPSTFAPVNNAPVPGNYRIGAGDTIMVQMFGRENVTHNITVNREGRIHVPHLEPLTVAGLSYDELKALIDHQVSTRMIGTQVAVSMGELRSMQIFVLGEAYRPGAYTVSSLTTISQALFASGGVSDIASLRNVQLKRAGETIVSFDLYDLLIHGDASKDRILQPGDAIFIPSRGDMIKVSGQVLRPAMYELKGNENVNDAIALAGGLLPHAHTNAVNVERVEQGIRQLRTINLEQETASFDLRAGDAIRVPRVSSAIENAVRLRGAVIRSGRYEWREGLRISALVNNPTQDLADDADLNYGLVVRESVRSRDISVLQFDVSAALAGESSDDIELQPRDEVIFFSRFESEAARLRAGFGDQESRNGVDDEQLADNSRERLLESVLERLSAQEGDGESALFVQVSGQVRFPGSYPLVENASVSDLIAAAGGLRQSAYLARAEITRTLVNGGEADTQYIPFNLYDALLGKADIAVQGRDRLNVFRIPEWQDTVEVSIEGEVRFPGTYQVRRGETMRDLLRRAEGVTGRAFLAGAVFSREEIREQEQRRMRRLAQDLRQEVAAASMTEAGSPVVYSELNNLINDLLEIEAVGRLVIDLEDILAGHTARDIELRDGDRLVIPPRMETVAVMGEVQFAGTHHFNPNLRVQDYLNKAGGTKRRADTRAMYVIRANGSIEPYRQRRGWFSSTGRVDLQPGDTVVVPLNTGYRDNLQLWSTTTQILYQSAVALAAINSL